MLLSGPVSLFRTATPYFQKKQPIMQQPSTQHGQNYNGPPVYTGLSQSAVLLQMHAHLTKLEDQHKQSEEALRTLRLALNHLLGRNTSTERLSSPPLGNCPTTAPISNPNVRPSSQGLEAALPNANFQKKKKKSRGVQAHIGNQYSTKTQCPAGPSQQTTYIPSFSIAESQPNLSRGPSLISRTAGVKLTLNRGKDPPATSTPTILEAGGQLSISPSIQIKRLPDGSFISRVRGVPKQGVKRVPNKKKQALSQSHKTFSPPPQLGVSLSSQSVQALSASAAPKCPPNPFRDTVRGTIQQVRKAQ